MNDPAPVVHAGRDDALGAHDAVGLAGEIAAGRVSVPEVVEAAIARSEDAAARLGGIAHPAYDEARRLARDPAGGFFAGVPFWVKDNAALAGSPTMEGTDAWDPVPARRDGDHARMARATGLLPLGKTQLSELGFSASAEHPRLGPVRNPWDPTRTAGASSAGSAVMVATGAVPMAHANDGGGSIRIPASCCGLVGLKPTRGRLAQDKGLREMPVRIVHDGVLTRTVRDTAAFYREAEKVYRDLSLPPVGDITRPGEARLRVALVTQSPAGPVDDDVVRLTHETAATLERLGHHVEPAEAPVPGSFVDDFLTYWAFLALASIGRGPRVHGPSWDPDRLDALTHHLARQARRRLPRLPLAIARLRASRRRSARFYANYDVVLTPTLAHPTPHLGHLDPTQDGALVLERLLAWVGFTPLQNATGDPAVSLPLARTAEGLPVGMMLSAGAGREALLLELAYELEEAVGWPTAPS
ncbi:amidase [Nocardioides sp. CFH 31398]|uniref:amidase n=1 Tax=Nocardioides sp. CFH 31398 TaxID=2919579 RepID=UPI001F0624EC|nr:amidase [Nocardioides sp. CFH 31398]MCH1865217.1 amidase [Nocardioides sp. CFH 31398]